MDEYLTDLIAFNGDPEVIMLWDNFTNPVSNSLQRFLSRTYRDDSWKFGICYNHLKEHRLSDLMDTPNVGEIRKNQILDELANVFGVYEKQGLDGWVAAQIETLEDIDDSTYAPDAVDLSMSLLDVVKGIIFYYNDYREIDDRTLEIIRARVPALMRHPKTLEELGTQFNITRERVRQIESKYLDLQLGSVKETNFVMLELVKVLENSLAEDEFVEKAEEADLLEGEPVTVAKLKAILQVLGLENYLSRVESVESQWDIANYVKDVLSQKAREARHKFGLIDLSTFTKENKVGEAEAFAAIHAIYPRSIRAGRLVLARTPGLDTAFENAIGKQLMVFNELNAESLLVGIERQANYRQTPLVGLKADLIAMIKELAGEIPNFATFRSNTLEDPELSQTDEWILEVFRDSPTGMMHRNEITAAAMRDGKNVNSIGVFLIFNSLIRPVGSAVLALADQSFDVELVKQYAAIARAAEEPTQLDFGFQGSDILITFIPNLNTIAAGVLFPKQELRDMVKLHSFPVECFCGAFESNQMLRMKNPSFWTGFTGSIKHLQNQHGYKKGQEIQMLLDMDKKTAKVLDVDN
jgi:hypothetical protein